MRLWRMDTNLSFLRGYTGRDSLHYCVAAVEPGGKRMSTGHSHLIVRVPFRASKKTRYQMVSGLFGTPEGTRTPNPRNRNPMLYPLSHRCICLDSLDIIAGFSRFVKGWKQNFSVLLPFFSAKPVVFTGFLCYNPKKNDFSLFKKEEPLCLHLRNSAPP